MLEVPYLKYTRNILEFISYIALLIKCSSGIKVRSKKSAAGLEEMFHVKHLPNLPHMGPNPMTI